jgi:Xaa-Pro aminopeptidase
MIRKALFVAGILVIGALAGAQNPSVGAGPAPKTATLGGPKPFPYAFVLPRPSAEELKRRRADLAKEIGDGAVIVVSAEKPALSSHRYAPDHNVYYLTGIDTDFCAMTMIATGGTVTEVKLFLPMDDDLYELWNGKRIVADDSAKAMSGIQDVVKVQVSSFGESFKPFEEALARLAESGKPIFVDRDAGERRPRGQKKLALSSEGRPAKIREFLKAVNDKAEIRPLSEPMTALRGVKSDWEVGVMREAVRITGDGFVRALRQSRPRMWEFDFQAVMDQTFEEHGCTGVPYFPIAASGPNACVYHYVDNRRQVQDGEIVLCDIAAEFGYYAADITRSFPANGKFTPRQKLVYEAVLAGQTAAARALRPGVSLHELDKVARQAMAAAGLKDKEMHQHGLGHHIGLDVHDLGGGRLEPGMIVTIEPGAYIKNEGMGIRIEDMYLVTADGNECLSAMIPKTVDEIEALVGADFRAPK